MDHVDLEQLNHLTQRCSSLWLLQGPPKALSKSLQIVPSIQILRIGKYTLITDPIPCAPQVSVQKAREGWKGHGMGERSPEGSG